VSLDPAILRALQAAGCSTDQIIAAVEADCALEEERKAKRRAGNAERQRRFKAKRKVTHANGSNALPAVTPPPNEVYSNPPPEPPIVISDEITPPADEVPVELKPEHVVEAWNATAERIGLAPVRKLTPERRRKLQTRIHQNSIDDFTEAIAAIERSPFLRGENDRGWKANFDFLLQPTTFAKLTEGTYDR
jgi:hypothetical protein